MNEMSLKNSQYCKKEQQTSMYGISVTFLFTLFVMPQYFGLPTPAFDLTFLRIMIVILVLAMLNKNERKQNFLDVLRDFKLGRFLIPYLIVITYTMVLRADINAFLNPFIEIVSFFLLIYVMKYEVGPVKTFQILRVFMYILAILGIIEFVIGRSPFSFLETIKGIYTGRFVRNGHYRIMGPAIHSLGYGLMLMCMIPFVCYDEKKEEISLFHRPVLLCLLFLNILLTGSRSTLAVFALEIVLVIFVSSKQVLKRTFLLLIVFVLGVILLELLIYNTSIGQYVMLQFTCVLDEVFGTSYSVAYGADPNALGSSSNYRDQLKYIFQLDWMNPFLGIGRKRSFSAEINGSYVRSVDDFYIAEFIRYAYPGLISYALWLIACVCVIARKCLKKKE